MRGRGAIAVFALACAAPGASAGTLVGTVSVRDPDGAPVNPAGAIVYVVGFSEDPPETVVSIEQRGRRFVPELVAVTVGQEVSFPNRDAFLHNVFSSSSVRPFDLGSYKQGESKKKGFPKAGAVDVYCNIHPEMAATILVLPNRKFARADGTGQFRIEDVPAGKWQAFAYVRLAAKPVSASVEISANGETKVELVLARGTAAPHRNKYGETYRDPAKYR